MKKLFLPLAMGVLISFGATAQSHSLQSGLDAFTGQDFDTAAQILPAFAEQGDPRAAGALGTMYVMGSGVPKDYNKAFSYIKSAAEAGLPGSQYGLGQLYYFGIGTEKSYENAFVQYYASSTNPKATNTQKGKAQFELARLYSLGHGVPKSSVSAIEYLQLAADNGHVEAAQKISK